MHVPIDNIMPATDLKDKLADLLAKINEKDFVVVTENNKPAAAVISIPHLMKLMHADSEDLSLDTKPESAMKPALPSGPNLLTEKDLPAPPKPVGLNSFGSTPVPPLPPLPPLPPKPELPDLPKPTPPLPPLPMPSMPPAPHLDDKDPLVTEKEINQVIDGNPPAPLTSDLPKPAFPPLPDIPKAPLPPLPSKPTPPASPVASPFTNVPSSSINPAGQSPLGGASTAVPASPMGTSTPPSWPVSSPAVSPAIPPTPGAGAADDLDDIASQDEIL